MLTSRPVPDRVDDVPLVSGARRERAGPQSRSGPRVFRTAVFLKLLAQWHRWLGIVMCLFFAMWFATGMVMLFVPFPDLSDADRFAAMPAIDMSLVRVTPARAAAELRHLRALEIIQGLDGPDYVMRGTTGSALAINAISGRLEAPLSRDQALSAAQAFCGCRPSGIAGPYAYDQWIVHQRFDPYRPFYRVGLAGPSSTLLYVSAKTGEVLQRTTRQQRVFNYAGSVVHWIYPTVLRKYPSLWSWTVWAISLAGITTAGAGLCLGVARSKASLTSRRKSGISPFKHLLRWHHLLGLTAGVVLLTWILSGWLSVDHGLLFPTGDATPAEVDAFQGMGLQQAASRVSLAVLQGFHRVSELQVNAVGGEAFLSGHRTRTGMRTTWTATGHQLAGVPDARLMAGAHDAWPDAHPFITEISDADDYGHLIYDGIPTTSVRIHLGDGNRTWVHVDQVDGRIAEIVDWRRRIYRWLFNGLHTFDVPGLERHDLIRKIVMLPLLLSGFTLSISGVCLSLKRVRRSFSQL